MLLMKQLDITAVTSSFLLYMPVFAALAGSKETLYQPLQAPAGGKVLYHRDKGL
jgi:hypothetical protein